MLHAAQYMARCWRLQWRVPLVAAVTLAAGGCIGLSIPLGDGNASPSALSGSAKTGPSLPQELPGGLAPSDASAIAGAAERAHAADSSWTAEVWQNPETGSSGTLRFLAVAEDGAQSCRIYAANVTSLKGVHRYTCRVCKASDGGVAVRSIEAVALQAAEPAGI